MCFRHTVDSNVLQEIMFLGNKIMYFRQKGISGNKAFQAIIYFRQIFISGNNVFQAIMHCGNIEF